MKQETIYKIPPKEIRVELYVDESKNRIYKGAEKETINYIMIMAVPLDKKQELYEKLNNARCLSDDKNNFEKCDKQCRFHSENNGEIHYNKLKKENVGYKIANKWLDILIENNLHKHDAIYFNVLGVIDENLDKSLFGDEKQTGNIYARFFKTALLRLLRMYDEYDTIIIEGIYHDKTNEMEQHQYFKTNSIQQIRIQQLLDNEEHIFFNTNKIEFIDSDHNISNKKESQFIQFVDLLLGVTCNIIHNEATNSAKIKLSEKLFPLISRILDRKDYKNKNSKYNYYNKQVIGFFPTSSRENLEKEYKEKCTSAVNIEAQLKNANLFSNTKQILFKIDDGQLSIF